MAAFFPVAPRVAFLCLSALLLGAAVPLAWAWTLVLPEEPEPFAAGRRRENVLQAYRAKHMRRDPIAIVLLVFVTLSYALQFPGVPKDIATAWIAKIIPEEAIDWTALGVHWFFIVIPGIAAIYALFALFRRNPMRTPLVLAGIFVLLLWLFVPLLEAAFLA
jgi:hypothetical protein